MVHFVRVAGGKFEQAVVQLGKANSAEAFRRATTLVEQVAESGEPDAAAMVATFWAMGAARVRDWGKALDWLMRAAEGGSDHAAGQMRLLAAGEGNDWRAMRARIDPAALLRAPEPISLSERPRLRTLPSFASVAECRWIIERTRPKLGPAFVWDEASGGAKIDPVRTSSALELRLAEMDVVTEIVRARISAATGLPEAIFEIPQVMHYQVGQEFMLHHDALDPDYAGHQADLACRGQRMGTFLIYLNDDFEGGETVFPKVGLSHRGGAGDALFFANVLPDGHSDPLALHAGKSPTSGEKWIFSQWIRDRMPA